MTAGDAIAIGVLVGLAALVWYFGGESASVGVVAADAGADMGASPAQPDTATPDGDSVIAQAPAVASASQSADAAGSDQDILARTIYGEDRQDGIAGMQAVGSVIRNRKNSIYFGFPLTTYASICKQANQFSCWQPGSADYNALTTVTLSDPTFAQCWQVAGEIIAGTLPDNTGGALFYHATSIATPQPPAWPKVTQTAQIGEQVYFALA